MNASKLMDLALQKYKVLKTKEMWEAPSEHEEKLMALEARMTELKKKFGIKDKGNKNQDKKDKKNKRKREHKEKPAWMFVRPTDGNLKKPRKWNGVEWHWCSTETGGKCSGQYRRHLPIKCKGSEKKPNHEGPPKKNTRVVINEAVTGVEEYEEEVEGGYESG